MPSPGDLPDPGIEPASPALQADSLPSEPHGKPPSPLPPAKDINIPNPQNLDVALHGKRDFADVIKLGF